MNVHIHGNTEEGKIEDDVDCPWSKLHPDLLALVFSHISFVDHPAFLCVCKSWRLAVLTAGEQHIKQLWLVEALAAPLEWDRRTFRLVNYSSRDKCSYCMDIPFLPDYSFLTAKHGWVLVGKQGEHGSVLVTMFYDPFSNRAIKLPPLNRPRWPVCFGQLYKQRDIFRFDFSAPLTSPECTVVATFTYDYTKLVFPAAISRGQAAWTSAIHHGFDCVWLPHRRMVFHEGSFYCVAGVKESHVVGKVLAFRPETNTLQGFSGRPCRAMAAERASTQMEEILCHRLEPAVAVDVVERLGGGELFRELQGRDQLVTVSKWRKQEGLAICSYVSLGILPFPLIYQPFLWEEGDQPLVPWHIDHARVERRAWLSPNWVQPEERDLQWVSSNKSIMCNKSIM